VLHSAIPVVDAHCDTLLAAYRGNRLLRNRSTEGHVDLPRLLEGGVNLQVFAMFPGGKVDEPQAALNVLGMINLVQRLGPESGLKLVESRADLAPMLSANVPQDVCALLSIEGAEALAGRMDMVDIYYDLGVRAMTLTWNHRNSVADGVAEARTGGGLTRFGRQVVGRMNELGMVVDVSHISPAGFWDVLELSQYPVIASHSNCHRICPVSRNLSDEQILALSRKDGVIGINFYPPFLCGESASVEDIFRHIDHIASLTGTTSNIGLGSDFDGIDYTPVDLPDVTAYPRITETLVDHGYSEQQIRGIMGSNLLHVFGRVLK